MTKYVGTRYFTHLSKESTEYKELQEALLIRYPHNETSIHHVGYEGTVWEEKKKVGKGVIEAKTPKLKLRGTITIYFATKNRSVPCDYIDGKWIFYDFSSEE